MQVLKRTLHTIQKSQDFWNMCTYATDLKKLKSGRACRIRWKRVTRPWVVSKKSRGREIERTCHFCDRPRRRARHVSCFWNFTIWFAEISFFFLFPPVFERGFVCTGEGSRNDEQTAEEKLRTKNIRQLCPRVERNGTRRVFKIDKSAKF